jgi:PKD repeat protein
MIAINRRVLRTRDVRVAYRIGALVCAGALSGCGFNGYKSDFPVVVGNRTASTITVFANGTEMGNVAAGGIGSFSVRLRENGSYGYQTDSPSTQVTFSARDLTTGKLSVPKGAIIFQDPPTVIDFTDADFQTAAQGPPSTTALAVSFTFSPLDPALAGGTNTVFFFGASSADITQWLWDFGDGGTGSGQNTFHTYLRAGTYVVRLSVTDSFGRTAMFTRNVTVR